MTRYDDQGKSLYILGLSNYYSANYDSAVKWFYNAMESGYDSSKIKETLAEVLFRAGSQHSNKDDYRNAIGYYKAVLSYQDDKAAQKNIIYCYLQLAKASPSPANVVWVLYAYDFCRAMDLRDESLEVVANNLCQYILKPPLTEFFESAVACIQEALDQKDYPYLHQTLGFIYLYQNRDLLAKVEFKKVVDDYKYSQFYAVCFDKYNDTGNADYQYQAKYSFFISGRNTSLASIVIKVLMQIPQIYQFQRTTNLRLQLNERLIPYQFVTDQYGTQYISCQLNKNLTMGKNRLSLTSDLTVEGKRINLNALRNLTRANYNSNDPRFKQLTGRNTAIDTLDPLVQKIAKDIMLRCKSDQIVDIIRAVDDEVIAQMDYRVTSGIPRKVTVKRALSNSQNAVCEDYAVLTVTLLRALQIPASYFSGDTYNQPAGHAWAVVYTPDYRPLPLDTTWGDTSGMPELYFLRSSNMNVVKSFSLDSNKMPAGTSIEFNSSSSSAIAIELGQSVVNIIKMNE